MNSNHYSELVPLKIYALISGSYVFVGKSKSPTLASAYSRHTHGYCYVTDGYFSHSGESRPQLYLLKNEQMTQAKGYKYLLAYIRWFEENDYEVINNDKSILQSQEMDSITESLYMQISSIPLATTLKLSYLPTPSTPIGNNSPPSRIAPCAQKELSSERLCVRLTREDKLAFEILAKDLRLSQRDLLVYLLNRRNETVSLSEDTDIERYIPHVVSSYEAKLASKEEKIQKLEQQLNPQKTQKRVRFLKKRIAVIQEGLQRYFNLANISKNHPTLVRGAYQRFSKSLMQDQPYRYPKEAGFMVFRPNHILWGKASAPVCFILGIGEDGERYKLRYYDKYYIGPRLTNMKYGYEGSEWLVAFEPAADGATDVVLSLPLDVLSVGAKCLKEDETVPETLASLITKAEMQKKHL